MSKESNNIMKLEVNNNTMGILDCLFKTSEQWSIDVTRKYNSAYMELHPKDEVILCAKPDAIDKLSFMLNSKIKNLIAYGFLIPKNRMEVEHMTDLCQLTVGTILHTESMLIVLEKKEVDMKVSDDRPITMICGHCSFNDGDTELSLREYFKMNMMRELKEEISGEGWEKYLENTKYTREMMEVTSSIITRPYDPLLNKHVGFIFDLTISESMADLITSGEPEKADMLKIGFDKLPDIFPKMNDYLRASIGNIPEILSYYLLALGEFNEPGRYDNIEDEMSSLIKTR